MAENSIIIVGGGIAGLICASELSAKYSVVLLEATNRIGGRINSFQPPGFDSYIEAGAEFVHGKATLTHDLLKKAGIKPLPFNGKMYRKEKGELVSQEEMIEDWDLVIKKMKALETDQTLHEFLQENFTEPRYDNLRHYVISFAEGFDIADPKKVSTKSLYKEWSKGEEKNDRLPNGYGELVEYLEKKCRSGNVDIFLNTVVKQVDWENNEVTAYAANGKKYTAEKMIITIPNSLLQQAAGQFSINFTPPLDTHVKASTEIGNGHVIKVIFQFRNRIWPDDTGFIFSDELIPTWWPGIHKGANILTGWCGGSAAERMKEHNDEQILEKARLSLASIFSLSAGQINKEVKAQVVFNWIKNPLVCGGYSYLMPGSEKAIKFLSTPINDTLYFAGEALGNTDSPGTVEAAISSALTLVKNF